MYSLTTPSGLTGPTDEISSGDAGGRTCMDQSASLCERMTAAEMEAMFDRSDDRVTVRSWLREGINWYPGNAADPKIASVVGPQDIVVANRFLCHMDAQSAAACLRNIGRLVKPGGHLFVSGIDLDVRTKVAREMGWTAMTDLMKEIHEGDVSLTREFVTLQCSGWAKRLERKVVIDARLDDLFHTGDPDGQSRRRDTRASGTDRDGHWTVQARGDKHATQRQRT